MAGALQHKYSGQALTMLGDKGRFVLPPEFRNTVKLSSEGRTLCLVKDEEFDCLVGFGLSREDEFEDMLDREEERAIRLNRDFSRLKRSNQLYGYKKIPFDDSGRLWAQQGIEAMNNRRNVLRLFDIESNHTSIETSFAF